MKSDLQIAIDALVTKKGIYDTFYRYYDGDQPLVYSSSKLREVFVRLTARFIENVCGIVVDAVTDRTKLRSIEVRGNEGLTVKLDMIREQSGLIDDEDQIHEDVAITGEAFVIAWLSPMAEEAFRFPRILTTSTGEKLDISTFQVSNDEVEYEIEAFRNDPRLCHVQYLASNPRRARFAAKWWEDDFGYVRLTLYYPDRLEYYTTRSEAKVEDLSDAKSFIPWTEIGEPVVSNPFGVIPVFHFRSNRRRPTSQLENVLPIQDMINKLIADMMMSSEFAAYPQRYVISQAGVSGLKNAPNELWDLVAADQGTQPTSAGQFEAADLQNYLRPIEKFMTDVGIITRTPRHFFFMQTGDPSGESLMAMEAPLDKKVIKLEGCLEPTWRDLGAFLLLLSGTTIASQELDAVYEPPQTVQPKTNAEIVKLRREAGEPLVTIYRSNGWTEEELAQMIADEEDDKARQQTYADAMLEAQARNFDRGQAR